MHRISILAMLWLITAPDARALSFTQATPDATSAQAPPSEPAAAAPTPSNSAQPAAKQETTGAAANGKTDKAPPSQNSKRRRGRKPVQPGQPRKIVVRQGGATEPSAKIVPGIPPQQASQQREEAESFITRAENNLKQLGDRTLDAPHQETLAQIRNYLEGARSALKDGDTQRAHTLALKAHLLADDLVKH